MSGDAPCPVGLTLSHCRQAWVTERSPGEAVVSPGAESAASCPERPEAVRGSALLPTLPRACGHGSPCDLSPLVCRAAGPRPVPHTLLWKFPPACVFILGPTLVPEFWNGVPQWDSAEQLILPQSHLQSKTDKNGVDPLQAPLHQPSAIRRPGFQTFMDRSCSTCPGGSWLLAVLLPSSPGGPSEALK